MYLLDDEGQRINADSSLDLFEGKQTIVIESSNGMGRNPDYAKLLVCIFGRLAQLGAKITRVIVDSKTAAKELTLEERIVDIEYPVDLAAVNIDRFRANLGTNVAKTARINKKKGDSTGNGTKRIRIFLDRNINADQLLYGRRLDTTDSIEDLSFSLKETERSYRRNSRVGQDRFREKLIKDFKGECAVTGITEADLLIASHIKPWKVCNNQERLDRHNGLLLSALADRLLDKGFITFDENGALDVSASLSNEDQERCGIRGWSNLKLKLTDKSKCYMEYHRTSVFKRD